MDHGVPPDRRCSFHLWEDRPEEDRLRHNQPEVLSGADGWDLPAAGIPSISDPKRTAQPPSPTSLYPVMGISRSCVSVIRVSQSSPHMIHHKKQMGRSSLEMLLKGREIEEA